jgi:trehalose-6-phosphate synthase
MPNTHSFPVISYITRRHFPGAASSMDGITHDHWYARLGAFPIGIDPYRFTDAIARNTAVAEAHAELKRRFGKFFCYGSDQKLYVVFNS